MYIDTVFGFYGYFFFLSFLFFTHLHCIVGYLRMIVWTPAVLGVLHACVLDFYICTCLAQLSMFHMERRSRIMLIIIIIIIIIIITIIIIILGATPLSKLQVFTQQH